MTLCVNHQLQPGRYATSAEYLTSFNAARNTTCQKLAFQVFPLEGAEPYNPHACCGEGNNCESQIKITICNGIEQPHVVIYRWTGSLDEALHHEIMMLILSNHHLRGLGSWIQNGASVEFVARTPGFNVDIRIDPGSAMGVNMLADIKGTDSTAECKHGMIVHTTSVQAGENCNSSGNLTGRRPAFAPTMDPNADGSSEEYAGIVVDMGHGDEIGYNTGANWGIGNSDACKPAKNCVEVLAQPAPDYVNLLLEQRPTGPVKGDRLYYRVTPSGEFTQTGLVSTVPGDGLIPLPIKVTVYEINGMYLLVKVIGACC